MLFVFSDRQRHTRDSYSKVFGLDNHLYATRGNKNSMVEKVIYLGLLGLLALSVPLLLFNKIDRAQSTLELAYICIVLLVITYTFRSMHK